MNKEQLIARINLLSQEAEQLRNNLTATVGAIQDCNYWLAELEKPAEPVEAAE